jgi:large subunit ribosomal protein L29
MQAKELRELSAADLARKQAELREQISHLRLKRATGRLENPMQLRNTKRDLARVETLLRAQQIETEKGAA